MQMAISKSVTKSQQRGVEQKDSNGVVPSMPFGADQGVPADLGAESTRADVGCQRKQPVACNS